MNDLRKLVRGKDFSDKVDKFEKGLSKIEEKYIEFFKDRKSIIDGEKHDRLRNHHVLTISDYDDSFGFKKTSDLPKHIQDECWDLLNETFKDGSSEDM